MDQTLIIKAVLEAGEVLDPVDITQDFIDNWEQGRTYVVKMYCWQIRAIDDSADWWFDVDFRIGGEFDNPYSPDHFELNDQIDIDVLTFHHPDGVENLKGNKVLEESAQKLILSTQI